MEEEINEANQFLAPIATLNKSDVTCSKINSILFHFL